MTEATTLQHDSQAGGQSPSTSAQPGSALASPQTPTTPPGSPPATPPARPQWMPETAWRADRGEPDLEKLGAEFSRLSKFETDDKARREALPQKIDDYAIAAPEGLQLPEGMNFNPEDPRWQAGREFALKHGMSKEGFSDLVRMAVEIDGKAQAAQTEVLKGLVAQRDAALGPRGAERVEALHRWLDSAFDAETARDMKAGMVTHRQIAALEAMQTRLATQGVTGFSAQGRGGDAENGGYPKDFDALPFAQQMAFHRQKRAS